MIECVASKEEELTAISQLLFGQRFLALVARHFLDLDQMRVRIGFVDHQNLADVLHGSGV